MDTPYSVEKLGGLVVHDASFSHEGVVVKKGDTCASLKHYFTSREGWIGDYVQYPISFSLSIA